MELPKKQNQQAGHCGPGCCSHRAVRSGNIRWVLVAIVLVAAGAIFVRARMKKNGGSTQMSAPSFAASATLPRPAGDSDVRTNSAATGQAAETSSETSVGSLSELNTLAKDMQAVFLFVPGKDGTSPGISISMNAAKRTIDAQWGIEIGLFNLKPGSRDYDQTAAQVSVPGVLVILKNGARSAISGDITETNLVRGFFSAVSSGGCCPFGGE